MSRRTLAVVAAGLIGLIALGVILLVGRGSDREAPPTTLHADRGTRVTCAGAAPATCAARAARLVAEREYPLAVEGLSCMGKDAQTYDCNVQLPTTCDSYRVRYAKGFAFVRRPTTRYVCMHLPAVED